MSVNFGIKINLLLSLSFILFVTSCKTTKEKSEYKRVGDFELLSPKTWKAEKDVTPTIPYFMEKGESNIHVSKVTNESSLSDFVDERASSLPSQYDEDSAFEISEVTKNDTCGEIIYSFNYEGRRLYQILRILEPKDNVFLGIEADITGADSTEALTIARSLRWAK